MHLSNFLTCDSLVSPSKMMQLLGCELLQYAWRLPATMYGLMQEHVATYIKTSTRSKC